jgi:transcriptional regulator with XRE-family HTH domain
MISNLWKKLRDPEYRKAFVASQINIGIPFQIRALLKGRSWTQDDLAKRAGMLQPRISAMLTPGKTRPNIETLRRVAEAFDCGLVVRFVPFGELTRWSEQFNPDTFHVPDYATEDKSQAVLESVATARWEPSEVAATAMLLAGDPDQTAPSVLLSIGRMQPGRATLPRTTGTTTLLYVPDDAANRGTHGRA